jgi:hypothetical protein
MDIVYEWTVAQGLCKIHLLLDFPYLCSLSFYSVMSCKRLTLVQKTASPFDYHCCHSNFSHVYSAVSRSLQFNLKQPCSS